MRALALLSWECRSKILRRVEGWNEEWISSVAEHQRSRDRDVRACRTGTYSPTPRQIKTNVSLLPATILTLGSWLLVVFLPLAKLIVTASHQPLFEFRIQCHGLCIQ